ncbi:MAG: RNA-binding S4 domain-containing protein [Synechococcus sp.]
MNDLQPVVELGQFIKLVGAAATGGQAKFMVQNGLVLVNGLEETRRRKKLVAGDRVTVDDRTWLVPEGMVDISAIVEVTGKS